MPALEGEVLDVRSARFGDSEPVQAQQHRQRGMVAIEPFGGEQERAEFGAVHATTLVWLHLGTPHVLRGVRPDPAVDVSEAVEPAHRRQASVDRRCRQPSLLHPTAVQLDVRARRREHGEVGVRRPLEEPSEIVTVGVQGAAVVASQESNGGELGVVDDRVVRWPRDCPRRSPDGDLGWSSLSGRNSQLRSLSRRLGDTWPSADGVVLILEDVLDRFIY